MRPDLLEVLGEPRTGAPYELVGAVYEGDEIVSGTLVGKSGARVPIVRGIPRFVPSEGYAGSFGAQWKLFRHVQLDSLNGGSRSEKRFDDETDFSKSKIEGRWLLDAGCGAGRFAEIAAARGARLVAVDLSSAVDATYETLKSIPGARFDVVQASIFDLPFRPETFDYAYSIGVLQHTPDPPRAMRDVLKCVKSGGKFGFTIYGRRPWTKLHGKYWLRPLTRRMPGDLLLKLIQFGMPVLFPMTDVLFRVPVLGKIARFAIPVANYVENEEFTRAQRYDETVLDTFDALSPWYDSPMTPDEAQHELETMEVQNFRFRTRIPVVVTGTR